MIFLHAGTEDVKGYLARKDLIFKFNDVKCLAEEAFDQVTAQKWYNMVLMSKLLRKKY